MGYSQATGLAQEMQTFRSWKRLCTPDFRRPPAHVHLGLCACWRRRSAAALLSLPVRAQVTVGRASQALASVGRGSRGLRGWTLSGLAATQRARGCAGKGSRGRADLERGPPRRPRSPRARPNELGGGGGGVRKRPVCIAANRPRCADGVGPGRDVLLSFCPVGPEPAPRERGFGRRSGGDPGREKPEEQPGSGAWRASGQISESRRGPLLTISALFQEQQKMHESQEPVSFSDVAVDFTREEWQQLEPAEKTTYRDVMLENYSHLVSVGYDSTKPNVIVRLEQGEEPWVAEGDFPRQSCPGGSLDLPYRPQLLSP
ncbi:uncharacterized protein V5649_021115 [Rhynchonycteris naso]